MLRETQRIAKGRRHCGYDWLVFVEVPIRYKKLGEFGTLYVDVMLVLNGVCQHASVSQCVLAIEHQGTTHQHAWKSGGDRLTGYDEQCWHDERKADAVDKLGLNLLCFDVGRNDVTGGALSPACIQKWNSKLESALIQMEHSCFDS